MQQWKNSFGYQLWVTKFLQEKLELKVGDVIKWVDVVVVITGREFCVYNPRHKGVTLFKGLCSFPDDGVGFLNNIAFRPEIGDYVIAD